LNFSEESWSNPKIVITTAFLGFGHRIHNRPLG
jgi:hypothetical protein